MTFTTSRGFTLIELIVVVAVVLIIVAFLLLPAATTIKERADAAKCIGNLRQINAVSVTYSSDNNGAWPPNSVAPDNKAIYANFLIPYLGGVPGTKSGNFLRSSLICPSAQTDEPDSSYSYRGFYVLPLSDSSLGKYGLSYAQNPYASTNSTASSYVQNRLSVENPSNMMLYMDFHGHYLATTGTLTKPDKREFFLKRHTGRLNIGYADGSVRNILFEDIPTSASPLRQFWSGQGLP